MMRSILFFGALLCAGPLAAAEQVHGASFLTLTETLGEVAAGNGASGAVILIGQGDAIFFTAAQGEAKLDTRLILPSSANIAQATLILALIDTGFLGIDDPARDYVDLGEDGKFSPTTIRLLMNRRAAEGAEGEAAASALYRVAETAASRPWSDLFAELVGEPAGLTATRFAMAKGMTPALDGLAPSGLIETTARDYARLLSLYSGDGMVEGVQVLSPDMLEFALMRQTVGDKACAEAAASGGCEIVESQAYGLYAWVDRPRGMYGVVAAPGAEARLTDKGRLLRAMASTIYDRESAASGLTSAIARDN